MKGLLWCAALGGATLLTGCNGAGGNTTKVTGKVTVAGAPLADIVVSFTPESGRPATGITDAGGNFTLSTLAAGDGAVPGKHKVSFKMNSSGAPPSSIPGEMPAGPPAAPFNAKYENSDTSGITAEVVAGTPATFEWNLDK